jgi:hypothetical protein
VIPRVTSALLVSALLRRVDSEGGSGVVVARGDSTSGSIVLICLEKGMRTGLRERILDADGYYRWANVGPSNDADEAEVQAWLAKRCRSDPDLWVLELDIAAAERFAAETSGDR